MDPGMSLFNPGEGVRVNTDDHGREEYEDDIEEQKRKEKELQELLRTEFDDLIDDDESNVSTILSEDGRQSPMNVNDQLQVPHWLNGKAQDTSTPKNITFPRLSMNYTPITNQKASQLKTVYRGNGGDKILEHVSEEGSDTSLKNKDKDRNKDAQDGPNHNEYLTLANGYVQNGLPNGNDGFQYQIQAHNLVNMKEAMIKQQEKSAQECHLLKHQLTLAKGEKESLAFSLQQARQLLADKEQQVFDFQKKIHQLERDLDLNKNKNNELTNQLEISRSSIDALKLQISEMEKFDTFSYLRSKNENSAKVAELKRKQEILNNQKELKAKDALIEKLKAQVEELEKYQEHTLPEKLKGINHLAHMLESVESHCQNLLSTEAMREAEYLTTEQNEIDREKEITSVRNALSDIGCKLQSISENQISVDAHTKALETLERDKFELQKKYEILSQEITSLENDKKELYESNRKLNATMETMIKKHDMDIKSAIEKYHSLHSKDTKLLQSELNEASQEEKTKLREFYEGKLALVYEEMGSLQARLNEAQELYLKVCQEKAQLETETNLKNKNLAIQGELQKAYSEMEVDLKNQMYTEYENKIKLIKEELAMNHNQELQAAKQNFQSANAKLETELSKIKDKLANNQNLTKQLESKLRYCENQSREYESKAQDLHHKLLTLQTEMTEQQTHFENTQKVFTSQMSEQQDDFNERLNFLEEAQRKIIDDLIDQVQKAMEREKNSIVSQSNEIIKKLQDEILHLRSQIDELKTQKLQKDFSCLTSLPTAKEDILFEELSKSTKYIQHLEKEMKIKSSIVRNSAETQTEYKMIEREHLIELNKLYKELVLELYGELDKYCKRSNQEAAEQLRLGILEYHHKFLTLNS